MDARSIIARLRDRKGLSEAEIRWFANGLANADVTDAQAGAFAMAAFLNGLSEDEKVALTLAMRDSGDVLAWSLPGPVIDKHSTGGIGDCVSLLLAPALASLGAYVPMVSGRGLGHTGGTLDKMESIPGLKTEVTEQRFREIVENVGAAIVSATGRIAPADKRLYAIRDVTATVESVDLITASILSKKLSAGLEYLVLDVKVGSGAFMKSMPDAEKLAQSLVKTANDAGCKTSALITDMNQPSTTSVGNALEVMEVMRVLCGDRQDSNLVTITAALGGELLQMAGLADTAEIGSDQIRETLQDGSAAERFGRMVTELGGPADFVERWRDRLPAAPVVMDLKAGIRGYVSAIDGQEMGLVVVHLGGGRLKDGDKIDPSVGLSNVALIGDPVDADTPIATIHAATPKAAEEAAEKLAGAYKFSSDPVTPPPAIYRKVN